MGVGERRDATTPDRLYGALADPAKSPLRATIRPGRNDIPLIAQVEIAESQPPARTQSLRGAGSLFAP